MSKSISEYMAEYKNTVLEISFPRLNSTDTLDYLKSILYDPSPTMIETCGWDDSLNMKRVRIKVEFDWSKKDKVSQVVDFLKSVFNPDFLKIESITTVPVFSDEWVFFEYLIRTMDWYYADSKNSDVWWEGHVKETILHNVARSLYRVHGNEYFHRAGKIIKQIGIQKASYLVQFQWVFSWNE